MNYDECEENEKRLTLKTAPAHTLGTYRLTGTKQARSIPNACPLCDGRLFVVENGAGCMECRTVILLNATSIEVERDMVQWGYFDQHYESNGPFRITSVTP